MTDAYAVMLARRIGSSTWLRTVSMVLPENLTVRALVTLVTRPLTRMPACKGFRTDSVAAKSVVVDVNMTFVCD